MSFSLHCSHLLYTDNTSLYSPSAVSRALQCNDSQSRAFIKITSKALKKKKKGCTGSALDGMNQNLQGGKWGKHSVILSVRGRISSLSRPDVPYHYGLLSLIPV